MTSDLDADGLSLGGVAEQITEQESSSSSTRPPAPTTSNRCPDRFHEVVAAGPSNEVAFDPTIHTAPGSSWRRNG